MVRRLALALALCLAGARAGAQQRPCDPPAPLGPSRDLYCIELVPAPGITGASGTVELGHVAGPFTVAVTPEGFPRHHLVLSAAALPAPASLGDFRTFVAWAAPPSMHPMRRLGTVHQGRNDLGVVELEKFVVLVTAEAGAQVREPSDRLVLRGQSPSTRLFPPDLLEFSIGRMGTAPSGGPHHHGAPHGEGDSLRWTTVPMPPGLTMLPAEMALRPRFDRSCPRGPRPPARPRELVRLQDGDTLRLEAGLVTRTLKGRSYPMYGFNGQYPGPLIERARRGGHGRFTNRLPHPTTVHWHGLRLDNRNDGVPGLTQAPVPPGGQFTYRLHFPDAGIYWYHPHVREDIQQDLGLVRQHPRAAARPGHSGPVASGGGAAARRPPARRGRASCPTGATRRRTRSWGASATCMLVNGEPGYRLTVRRGEVVRFYPHERRRTRGRSTSRSPARG